MVRSTNPHHPHHRRIIGGCRGTRFGCCPDRETAKEDPEGTNCYPKRLIGGCAGTRHGCCPNGRTARANRRGSNC